VLDVEVPDARAEEADEPPSLARQVAEVALEVADDPADVRLRVLPREPLHAFRERHLVHVEQHDPAQAPRRAQRVEQEPGLLRRPGAELDERVGLRDPRDVGRVRLEDLALAAREVVLGQRRDLAEEPRAPLVVVPLGRDPLRGRGEAVAHVRLERRAPVAGPEPRVDRAGVAGEPDAREDLPPDREVPVAEGQARDGRMGRPRAAAQDAVLVAEEDLRVLRVRERGEAGVARERRRGPLPHLADAREEPRAGGPLPLLLRGEPRAGPARERLGLVEGHVLHGLVRIERLVAPEAAHRPVGPAERRANVLRLAPGPALVAPELAPAVAAVRDELEPRAVRHRGRVDAERGQLLLVRRALVVVGPRVVRAEPRRSRGDEDVAGRGHRGGGAARVRKARERDRLEHRLAVLALVLEDEAEREPVREQRVGAAVERHVAEHLERPVAHAAQVVPCGGGVE
jgi:hypothetical protein